MAGRIITVRHGRPDLARDQRIAARDYGDWWAAYDRSGLAPDQGPSACLQDIANAATSVLSSTLPRAIETAAQLTGGARPVPADALYVEAPLPPPPVPMIKLKPGTWGVISRTYWFFGYAPNGIENHQQAWDRVARICDGLIEIADQGDVVLCAHGYLNWMIDRHSRKIGWRRVKTHGVNHYWSYRVYELEETASAVASQSLAAQ